MISVQIVHIVLYETATGNSDSEMLMIIEHLLILQQWTDTCETPIQCHHDISASHALNLCPQNSTGARQDLILGLLLDPTNEDVISILSRLFPGKSVADVINSPVADAARYTLENLVATASPIRLQPLDRQVLDSTVLAIAIVAIQPMT